MQRRMEDTLALMVASSRTLLGASPPAASAAAAAALRWGEGNGRAAAAEGIYRWRGKRNPRSDQVASGDVGLGLRWAGFPRRGSKRDTLKKVIIHIIISENIASTRLLLLSNNIISEFQSL